jgi:hypothetical protein
MPRLDQDQEEKSYRLQLAGVWIGAAGQMVALAGRSWTCGTSRSDKRGSGRTLQKGKVPLPTTGGQSS